MWMSLRPSIHASKLNVSPRYKLVVSCVRSPGSKLLQCLVVVASSGPRHRVMSNCAAFVYALALILSGLPAPPITSDSRLPVGGWEAGNRRLGELFVYTANCSCCFLSLAQTELLGCITQVSALSQPRVNIVDLCNGVKNIVANWRLVQRRLPSSNKNRVFPPVQLWLEMVDTDRVYFHQGAFRWDQDR